MSRQRRQPWRKLPRWCSAALVPVDCADVSWPQWRWRWCPLQAQAARRLAGDEPVVEAGVASD
eukprot:11776728-Alexandrium_andersonii.AAC.1